MVFILNYASGKYAVGALPNVPNVSRDPDTEYSPIRIDIPSLDALMELIPHLEGAIIIRTLPLSGYDAPVITVYDDYIE